MLLITVFENYHYSLFGLRQFWRHFSNLQSVLVNGLCKHLVTISLYIIIHHSLLIEKRTRYRPTFRGCHTLMNHIFETQYNRTMRFEETTLFWSNLYALWLSKYQNTLILKINIHYSNLISLYFIMETSSLTWSNFLW